MALHVQNLCKTYEEKPIIQDFSFSFREDGVYCLMAPSGAGKTTLLGILAGLVSPDSGSTADFTDRQISMAFQEDRLLEQLSATDNLRIAVPTLSVAEIREMLAEILPEDSLDQPVRELSGGMRRRVSVARAVARPGDILLLDEPFAGLDEAMHEQTAQFLVRHRKGRLMIAATHQREDAALLGGEIFYLNS